MGLQYGGESLQLPLYHNTETVGQTLDNLHLEHQSSATMECGMPWYHFYVTREHTVTSCLRQAWYHGMLTVVLQYFQSPCRMAKYTFHCTRVHMDFIVAESLHSICMISCGSSPVQEHTMYCYTMSAG
jgi:hypothetical protein